MSRFSILLDSAPAGQLYEFPILRADDVILAVLHPRGYRSTWMMHPDPQRRALRFFSYRKTPIEILDRVIKWAEKIAMQRIKHYDETYHWRKQYKA